MTKANMKKFRCDICDYASNERSKVQMHGETFPLKERSFNCELCGTNFAAKSSLKKHKIGHKEKSLLPVIPAIINLPRKLT